MAGQAAFDFVFKEMIPEGAKKDAKPSTSQEESPVSAKKVSLKWRPAVSDLASEDEKDPCVDGQPSCSWGSLAKASSKTSLSLQVEDEKFQVQLALEDGKLALEDEVNKKHDDDTPPSGSSKQPACKKKLATACQKKPASKKTDKPKGEECKKKVKASPCTKKSYKVQTDERKTFANRTCPPGPEGSTRFEAIKKAYNEVIKERISRNQEVGFCLLALTVKVFHSHNHMIFVLKPITGRLCSGPFVARHGRGRSWPCTSTRRSQRRLLRRGLKQMAKNGFWITWVERPLGPGVLHIGFFNPFCAFKSLRHLSVSPVTLSVSPVGVTNFLAS